MMHTKGKFKVLESDFYTAVALPLDTEYINVRNIMPVHLPGQNIFCPGQNQICPRQIILSMTKYFLSMTKILSTA